ncbi:acyl-CoA:lysophosphatidylglycerol acyltransferase 1 isoform X2 [Carcharodon carcharias]|uniref:acyl-CoA:lysophosphatidylglycerol acyltransferase 1 isoform X2 n=1 Tax=Carcharodon carcharias TaxID=13397 RepID=UPI001B7F3D6F|nr:acyl-CoA:lysophosphatidylglycerol acyltransferase 1 isoform X2 [Carcharodon carcharias]
MAMNRKEIQRGSWILVKGTIRFLFMVINNLVAIPSYVLYLIVLQPLKLLNSKLFWHVEGIMFKWLLAMVSSWGWTAGYTVVEWGDDVKAITEDETMVLVNHQATGDVCTLMMCLQDKGTVVCHMMWLMEYIFKFTNFGVVSLIHGDFFIRQGKAHRDQQLILLRQHLEKYYRSRDRKWIVLFPEGGFLRKRRETSQSFAKKNNLPFLKHVTLPRQGATEVILQTLCAQHENGAVGDANGTVEKQKGLQWVIDITIAYHKAKPIDIQTWIIGYREPTVTHVHYRVNRRTVEVQPLTKSLHSLAGRSIHQVEIRQAHQKTGPDFHDKYGNAILVGGLAFCVADWSYVAKQTGLTWNVSPIGKITAQNWRED